VLTYNESVVTRYDPGSLNGVDKTGMVGITIIDQGSIFHNYKLDHAYVSLDKDASKITESHNYNGYGIQQSHNNLYLDQMRETKYFLQLNLTEDRKTK